MYILELVKLMYNEGEPICKRLRIADNAFKARAIPIQHQEAILLKWLVSSAKNDNDIDVWETLNKCLLSDQIKNLGQSDLTQEDIIFILSVIILFMLNYMCT